MTVQNLILNLNKLNDSEEIIKFIVTDEKGFTWFNETSEGFLRKASGGLLKLVNDVIFGCDAYLITTQGQHNAANRIELKKAGFFFAKGEEDSFGPLTSVLILKNFRIVYG